MDRQVPAETDRLVGLGRSVTANNGNIPRTANPAFAMLRDGFRGQQRTQTTCQASSKNDHAWTSQQGWKDDDSE